MQNLDGIKDLCASRVVATFLIFQSAGLPNRFPEHETITAIPNDRRNFEARSQIAGPLVRRTVTSASRARGSVRRARARSKCFNVAGRVEHGHVAKKLTVAGQLERAAVFLAIFHSTGN